MTAPPRRRIVRRVRVSRRQLAAGALLVAVLAGEVAGRWLVAHLPPVADAPRSAPRGLAAWPGIVVAAKIGLALLLARLAWRLVQARRVARSGERLLRIACSRRTRPGPSIGLSPRAWLASFTAMSLLYLVPTSGDEIGAGAWPLAAPWPHLRALPVFGLLALVIAVLWRTISRWLGALEAYGERLQSLIRSTYGPAPAIGRTHVAHRAPRLLFGVAFESRPPPARA